MPGSITDRLRLPSLYRDFLFSGGSKIVNPLTLKLEMEFKLTIYLPQVILTPLLEICNLLEYVILHLW